MKKPVFIAAAILMLHCNESETQSPPQITVDLSPAWAGTHSTEDNPYSFNLHLRNEGEQTLKITDARIRHDQNCAFDPPDGPDKKELGENESSFVRITYNPQIPAEDSVTLVVKSNSEKYSTFIIPICGIGMDPEDFPQQDTDSDTESGEEEPQDTEEPDRTCNAPPNDQPDCDESENESGGK